MRFLRFAAEFARRRTSVRSIVSVLLKGESVGIGRLERFVADWFMKHGSAQAEQPSANGHKVAVVGSGPASLTCAGDLGEAWV